MAFHANSFLNQSNVPPLLRLINGVTSQSVSGFSQAATTIAQRSAENLTTQGASISAAQSGTAALLDGLLSYGSPDFFAASGLAPSKAAAADVSKVRIPAINSKTYFATSNPNIKVDQKTRDGQAIVVSIL